MAEANTQSGDKLQMQMVIDDLSTNIPNVKIKNKVKFDSEVTYDDFKKINNTQLEEENMQKQKAKITNTHKYTDISQINYNVLNDIENGNIEKYFSSDIVTDVENNNLMEILHQLAEQNNANAQNILGVCYLTGISVQVDEKQSIDYLTSAAEQDHTSAQRNLAIALENQGSPDKNKIISLYEKAANNNDAYAINNLAVCYLLGDGVKQNLKQAVKYFEKAVKANDDYAMVNLADCYSVGNGVVQNNKKAFDLYKKAADKGNIYGLRSAADCYLIGTGTKQDIRMAMDLYKKASDLGDEKATQKYEELSEKLNPQKYNEVSLSEDKQDKNKKPTLSEMFSLGKKSNENKENTAEEKSDSEITSSRKSKPSDISL
jgi:TPR repeat protein